MARPESPTRRGRSGVSAAWFSTGGISKADARDGNPERDPFHSVTAQANGPVRPGGLDQPGRPRPLQPRLCGAGQFRRPHRRDRRPDGQASWMALGLRPGPDHRPGRVRPGPARATAWTWTGCRKAGSPAPCRPSRPRGGASTCAGRRSGPARGRTPSSSASSGRRTMKNTGDGGRGADNLAGFAAWRFTPSRACRRRSACGATSRAAMTGVTTARRRRRGQAVRRTVAERIGRPGFKAPSIFQTTYPCPRMPAPRSRPGAEARARRRLGRRPWPGPRPAGGCTARSPPTASRFATRSTTNIPAATST